MGKLSGKIALVTGAARGIGKAIGEMFHQEGALVTLTDIRDEQGMAVAAALSARAVYAHLDVRIESDWEHVTRELVRKHGTIDVLVNNAGITGFETGAESHDPEHVSLDTWRAVFSTNLEGVVLGCRFAISTMRTKGWGSIINLGSRSGVVGIPGATPYAASKAAVRNHTKSVALYCAEQGLAIRCNVIQPAAILTPMWDQILGDGPDRTAREKEYTQGTPLARFGTVDEVAAIALYLAADESAFTTGAEFNIDGGMLAGTAVPPRPPGASEVPE